MTHEIAIPAVAAVDAEIKLFFMLSSIALRVKSISQYLVVKFADDNGLPKFFVNDVIATVINGITITINASPS